MSSQDISTDRVYNMLLQDIVVNKVKACEKCLSLIAMFWLLIVIYFGRCV